MLLSIALESAMASTTHSNNLRNAERSNRPSRQRRPPTSTQPTTGNTPGAGPVYPEALQSSLSRKYPSTVLGTVIIGDDFRFSEDMFEFFEIINPPLDELQNTPTVCEFFVERAARRLEEEFHTHIVNQSFFGNPQADAPVGSTDNATTGDNGAGEQFEPVPPKRSASTIKRAMSKIRRFTKSKSSSDEEGDKTAGNAKKEENKPELTVNKVVRAGGYILFSNRYVTANPHSHIAGLTKAYRLAKPPPPIEIDTTLPPEKQRTQQLVAFIREATEQSRPLFRMRAAASVYGESEYVPSDDAEALVDLQVRTYLESESPSLAQSPQSLLAASGPSQFYSSLKAYHLSRSAGASCHESAFAPSQSVPLTEVDT